MALYVTSHKVDIYFHSGIRFHRTSLNVMSFSRIEYTAVVTVQIFTKIKLLHSFLWAYFEMELCPKRKNRAENADKINLST
jgi:hypothetical protein